MKTIRASQTTDEAQVTLIKQFGLSEVQATAILAMQLRKQGRGGKGRRGMTTREEDVIEHVVNASTHDFLLFFTSKGRVFRLKTYEVPASSLNAKGIAIVNLLQLQPEETVSAVININKQ